MQGQIYQSLASKAIQPQVPIIKIPRNTVIIIASISY
jgi:hypothetical protein